MFYSPETGFTEHAVEGAYEITHERYVELLNGQSDGKIISAYADGKPYLKTPDPLTAEQQTQIVLARRQAAYRAESDPLYMEWQFDQDENKKEQWRASVEDIKARYPLP